MLLLLLKLSDFIWKTKAHRFTTIVRAVFFYIASNRLKSLAQGLAQSNHCTLAVHTCEKNVCGFNNYCGDNFGVFGGIEATTTECIGQTFAGS